MSKPIGSATRVVERPPAPEPSAVPESVDAEGIDAEGIDAESVAVEGIDSEGIEAAKPVPTVVIDDVHFTYRIIGKRRGGAPAAMRRVLLHEPAPGQRSVHAVKGVSFTAYRGEAIGVIGPNGSGKSTLLRGIAGLMAPSSGAVWTRGQASLLGVSAAMVSQMSGDQNILLGCLAIGMTPAEIIEEYDAICEFADIGEFVHLPMSTYSSGMAARLRFAIAAARAPDILLIDEALATGDAKFRRRSEKRILELREQAGTVFLVAHGLSIIRDTCTRAVWLDEGRVVLDGDAATVVEAYEDRYDPEARLAREFLDENTGVDDLDQPSSF